MGHPYRRSGREAGALAWYRHGDHTMRAHQLVGLPCNAWTEDEIRPEPRNICGLLDQPEVPATDRDIAIKHRADELVVAQHKLLVEARGAVEIGDFVVALGFRHERTGRKNLDASDLEPRRK